MTRRIDWVDIAKGIGVLFVVFGHAVQGVVDSQGLAYPNVIWLTKNFIYSFHMPLFFFLSGLFIEKWLSLDIKTAVIKRMPLMASYFFWSLVTGICMEIVKKYTNAGLGIADVLKSPIIPFSQYWYLYVLFLLSMITWFLMNSILKEEKHLVYFALVLFIASPWVPYVWVLNKVVTFYIFFVLGYYFGKNKLFAQITQIRWAVVALLAFVGSLPIYFILLDSENNLSKYAFFVTASSGSWLVFYLSSLITRKNLEKAKYSIYNILSFLGKQSLLFYVVHLIPLAMVRIIMIKLLNINDLWIVVFGSFIFSMLVSYMTYFVLAKIGKMYPRLNHMIRYIV